MGRRDILTVLITKDTELPSATLKHEFFLNLQVIRSLVLPTYRQNLTVFLKPCYIKFSFTTCAAPLGRKVGFQLCCSKTKPVFQA